MTLWLGTLTICLLLCLKHIHVLSSIVDSLSLKANQNRTSSLKNAKKKQNTEMNSSLPDNLCMLCQFPETGMNVFEKLLLYHQIQEGVG